VRYSNAKRLSRKNEEKWEWSRWFLFIRHIHPQTLCSASSNRESHFQLERNKTLLANTIRIVSSTGMLVS
jgi:hypothetical protein